MWQFLVIKRVVATKDLSFFAFLPNFNTCVFAPLRMAVHNKGMRHPGKLTRGETSCVVCLRLSLTREENLKFSHSHAWSNFWFDVVSKRDSLPAPPPHLKLLRCCQGKDR